MMATPKPEQHLPMTKAEIRKTNKPLVEKRRRERINTCLDELKMLVLQALQRDSPEHSKLEKADILELTVSHLKSLQRHQAAETIQASDDSFTRYKSGFTECASEISRYLQGTAGVDAHVQQSIMAHLGTCMMQMNKSDTAVPSSQQQQQQQQLLQQKQQTPMTQVHIQIPTATPSSVLPGNSIPALTLVQNQHQASPAAADVSKPVNAVMMSCAALSVPSRSPLLYANVTASQPFGLYLVGDATKAYAAAPPRVSPAHQITATANLSVDIAHRQSNAPSKIKTVHGTAVHRVRPVWRPWSLS